MKLQRLKSTYQLMVTVQLRGEQKDRTGVGGAIGKTMDLPARSRFGEGRAAPSG